MSTAWTKDAKIQALEAENAELRRECEGLRKVASKGGWSRVTSGRTLCGFFAAQMEKLENLRNAAEGHCPESGDCLVELGNGNVADFTDLRAALDASPAQGGE